MHSNLRLAVIVFSAILGITAIFAMKGPLQDVHMDAPIYIARGKEFALTPYLQEYALKSTAIADDLRQGKLKDGTPYWAEETPYWDFIRLGNTMLLGVVAMLFGTGIPSLYASFWLYTAILAAALVTGALMARAMALSLGEPALSARAIAIGTFVSSGLYLASDIYRHLSGNTVSEVPALLLLTGAALCLLKAAESRSVILAVGSGALAFVLYVVRAEAVWAYLSFLVAFALTLPYRERSRWWLGSLLVSATTAFLMLLMHAWVFWPLPDPRLFAIFASGVQEVPKSGIPAVKLLIAAGGALWIGLLLALLYAPRNRITRLALIWLALLVASYADALLGGRQTSVRMYAPIMAPLLLASTVGWAAILDRVAAGRSVRVVLPASVALALAIIAVSQAESYQLLRQLPGGWRLQYVREWLSPPAYERLDYPFGELHEISQFLSRKPSRTVLVPDRSKLEEHLRIISYLAPTRPETAAPRAHDIAQVRCGSAKVAQPSTEHVMWCEASPNMPEVLSNAETVDVLFLRQRREGGDINTSAKETVVFRTAGLELVHRPVNDKKSEGAAGSAPVSEKSQ